jgi:hypothetical protein
VPEKISNVESKINKRKAELIEKKLFKQVLMKNKNNIDHNHTEKYFGC